MFFAHPEKPVNEISSHFQANVQKINQLPISCNGLFITLKSSTPLAKIIKLPPTEQPSVEAASFNDLECSSEDVQKITRLISVMGENGKLTLLVKYQKELRQIGREIEHVHPLKFLSVILSDPYLKTCMKKINSDYFKWSNLMDGLANGLSVQAKQGKVAVYLKDFAQSIGISPESIQGFVEKQQWEDMTVYVINN